MIRITPYRDYFKSLCTRLRIPCLKMVSSETQIISFLRDTPTEQFPVMVLIIPSSDSISQDEDNILEPSTGLVFILIKTDITIETEDSFLNTMQQTQDIMAQVKSMMLSDRNTHVSPHFLHNMDFDRLHTDPEVNLSGCNGWSLSFVINSQGF